MADEDGDGKLNKEEFADYLHPGQAALLIQFCLHLRMMLHKVL